LEILRALPHGYPVSISSLRTRKNPVPLEATLDAAAKIRGLGLTAVPHLPARYFESLDHLKRTLLELGGSGITRIFFMAGNSEERSTIKPAIKINDTLEILTREDNPFFNCGLTRISHSTMR
jgi:methylenetetrahydrofolate reductase (NADPH)